MEKIENRGRGLLIERKSDLMAICLGIRTGEYKPTHYMKGQLIKAGYLEQSFEKPGAGKLGRSRTVLKLTPAGSSLANLQKAKATRAANAAAKAAEAAPEQIAA